MDDKVEGGCLCGAVRAGELLRPAARIGRPMAIQGRHMPC